MKKNNYTAVIFLFLLIPISLLGAKNTLKGYVTEKAEKGEGKGMGYVNVQWLGSTKGSVTNENGYFILEKPNTKNNRLIVSFLGYKTDTISISDEQEEVRIEMVSSSKELSTVTITEKMESSFISKIEHQKKEMITSDGLCRLACCNLAESFENSATVDVGFSDAVSGARQIQMLGLSGIYSQLMLENIPFIRGLSAPFGLNYVPGSFMEGIQISKGVSSVVNGYESMTGQINLEYRKPKNADPLFVNLFLNSELRGEVNAIGAHSFNNKLSTMGFVHGSWFNRELDHIGMDGFMDIPKSYQINLVNRWFYDTEKYKNISLINYVKESRTGGQMGFEREYRNTDSLYGIGIDNQRLQFTTKNGILLSEENSMALQLSGTYFQQKAFYGNNEYKGSEGNLYLNLIYEKHIFGENKLTTGLSYQYNDAVEHFKNGQARVDTTVTLNTKESVPGVFAQFAGELSEQFSFIAGMRYDYNTLFGSLYTPRLHVKWAVREHTTLRASAGKGYRTAFVLAENFGLMASSRRFSIQDSLQMEEAWNLGFNLVQDFTIGKDKKGTFTFDYYHTNFINQVVIDMDHSAHEVQMYMLDGRSFSNSLQADLKLELMKGFMFTLAGRYNDVKQTIGGELIEKPYVSKWKGLTVLSYATKYDKWIFDLTNQWNGRQRLPNTNGFREEYSSPYFYMLGQVTRKFKTIDLYFGCENITNVVQKDPIIAANDPFGKDFDASVIYAPMMGRLFYMGLRWTLK